MHSFAKKSFLCCLTILIGHTSFAQEDTSFRALLSKVYVDMSVGYGGAQYIYKAMNTIDHPNNTVLFKKQDQLYFYAGTPEEVYLIRWFDGPDTHEPSEGDLDFTNLEKVEGLARFQGKGNTLPISLVAHVDLWSKMRVGLGIAFLINKLEKLEHKIEEPEKKPESSEENPDESEASEEAQVNLGPYIPTKKTHYCVRPFVYLGYKFVENSILSVLLDTTLGYDYMYSVVDRKFGDVFNLGAKSLGITVENNISEYFRLFGRIAYERSDMTKSFNERVGAASNRQSVLLQCGFSFNYPEVPRCQLSACKIERKHKHGGKIYRGVSIFTNRDSQDRRIYKK